MLDFNNLLILLVPNSLSALTSGLIAGLFGVGGGIILVPAIVFTLEYLNFNPLITMHIGIATSLMLIIPTSISSIIGHHKMGVVDYSIIFHLAPYIVIGSIFGAKIAQQFSGESLKLLFGCMAIIASINMMREIQLVIGNKMPRTILFNSLSGFIIGSSSSMVGIGGGALSVPLMNFFSTPQHNATGTASALGLLIAVPSAITFSFADISFIDSPPWTLGMISIPVFIVFSPLTIIGAQIGVKIAHNMNGLILRKVFSVFLFLMALRMIFIALTG